jgi:CubicO group peptidase (beta-lactamase class C family)
VSIPSVAPTSSRAREVDDGPLPSCQLAVARDGCVVVFETIGAATPMSRYVTFSITKALVAAAAWLLTGDGLLDPTAPIAETIPGVRGARQPGRGTRRDGLGNMTKVPGTGTVSRGTQR